MKRLTRWVGGVLLLAGCYDLRGTPGTDAGSDAGSDAGTDAGVPLDVVDAGESVDAVDAAGMDAESSDVVDAGESIDAGMDADVPQDQGPQDVAVDHSAPADAAEDGGDAAEASVDTGIAACTAGELRCGDACVQPQTDPAHCGACGNRCTLSNATATCTDGACRVLACTEGFADCDGTAANGCEQPTRSDNAHCGACRNACTQGRLCVEGACTCPSGQTFCTEAMACLNLQRDNNHCGACGNACTGGQSCQSGVCACPTGQTLCNGACVNTSNDLAHCGACGSRCTAGQVCAAGLCDTVCPAGQTNCAGTCRLLAADVDACGACTSVCPTVTNATRTCTRGMCNFICNTGRADCDGMTENGCEASLTSDRRNCGRCGSVCRSNESCQAGVCSLRQRSCPDPTERGCGVIDIPGGTFIMGEVGTLNAEPTMTATVSSFAMDAYEVTVGRFRRYWLAGHTGITGPIQYPGGNVAWTGQVVEPSESSPPSSQTAFCNWRASRAAVTLIPSTVLPLRLRKHSVSGTEADSLRMQNGNTPHVGALFQTFRHQDVTHGETICRHQTAFALMFADVKHRTAR